MDKVKSCVVIASGKNAALELVSGAAALAESVSLVCLGEVVSAEGVEAVYSVDTSVSAINFVPAIVKLVADKQAQLVLCDQSKNGRLAAAMVAAANKTSVQVDANSVEVVDGAVVTKRVAYGGLAVKTEKSGAVAVIVVSAATFPAAAETAADAATLESAAVVETVDKKAKEQQRTNLAAAKKVVGVGRGVGSAENLELVEQFAAVLGAEVGCTRPVAEEDKLMPSNRYIGVSGVVVKPELYIALGLSGQVQHTAGMDQSGVVIAINKDEKAPIFKECDFGVVGNMMEIMPKVIEALK